MIKVIFDGGQIAELNNVECIIIDWADRLKMIRSYVKSDTLEQIIIFNREDKHE